MYIAISKYHPENQYQEHIFRSPFAKCWLILSPIDLILRVVKFKMNRGHLIRTWDGKVAIYVIYVQWLEALFS